MSSVELEGARVLAAPPMYPKSFWANGVEIYAVPQPTNSCAGCVCAPPRSGRASDSDPKLGCDEMPDCDRKIFIRVEDFHLYIANKKLGGDAP